MLPVKRNLKEFCFADEKPSVLHHGQRSYNQDEYLEFAYFNIPRIHDGTFDLNSIPYSNLIRFIQLLPTVSNYFFMKTSKTNYRMCLDLRGIECSRMTPSVPKLYWPGGYPVLQNAPKSNSLYLTYMPPKWVPYLVLTRILEVRIEEDIVSVLNFVKRNRILRIKGREISLGDTIKVLQHLTHANLQIVSVDESLAGWRFPAEFSTKKAILTFLGCFKMCKKLKVFQMQYGNSNKKKTEIPEMSISHWKEAWEEFYGDHMDTFEICNIQFYSKLFAIDQGVLKFVKKLVGKKCFLIESYDPETVLTDNI